MRLADMVSCFPIRCWGAFAFVLVHGLRTPRELIEWHR